MNEKIPKVFISYSWGNADRVIELATRLMESDGIEVVLDKWELKEGQDKYAFMERSVTDPSIDKVLMICDKAYAEKANNREGGVGDETMVISSEVYAKATETKYIPIIFERDENGEEYTPAYLKSRIYIDLCADNEQYEQEYEKLLRNLYNKPENRKPALGKMPEWLNDETVDFSGIRSLLKQVQAYDGKKKNKIEFIVRKFSVEFTRTLLSFTPVRDKDFDEKLLIQIDATKPLRDLYFDYVEALIISDLDVGAVIGDYFEQIYNGTYIIEGRNSYNDIEFDFPKFLIWEMFIGTTAILLHYEKYREIHALLNRTYFLVENPIGRDMQPNTFTQFRPPLRYIEEYIKPKSGKPNLHTLAGDIVVKREKQPIITPQSLVNADIVLYQLSRIYYDANDMYYQVWFPKLYIYGVDTFSYKQSLWSKMVSQRHCEKLFPLFGVTELSQLKKKVENSKHEKEMHYPGALMQVVSIQSSIGLDKIGTMP
jgi:hypothetical protein